MAIRAVIVGGGHNGLAAAAYLARAGVRVLLLERREVLGGACVTEELWPGFLVSCAAYVVGLLRPAAGWSRYSTPLRGLYLCGAGAHPGGGVMGACGRNAAREAIRGLGRRSR